MTVATVRLWLVDADACGPDLSRLHDVLDDEERERAAALVHAPDRDHFIAAHGALRCIVGQALDMSPHALRWTRGRFGKPELAGVITDLRVNLSHSGAYALVAVSWSRAVGVDVQHLVPTMDTAGMAARFFPPDEARFVGVDDDVDARADRFAHLWARKEAVIKAGGGRLWGGLGTAVLGGDTMLVDYAHGTPPGVYRVRDVPVPAGYRAAVALVGDGSYTVDIRRWKSTEATDR